MWVETVDGAGSPIIGAGRYLMMAQQLVLRAMNNDEAKIVQLTC